MKFALGGILQESNTFCPKKTTMERFNVAVGEEIISEGTRSRWFFGGVIDAARELGVELYPTLAASANPYGTVDALAYNHLTGELYERLKQARPMDGVVRARGGGAVE